VCSYPYIASHVIEGVVHLVRVLTFVDGIVLDEFEFLADEVLRSIGSVSAQTSRSLAAFAHPGANRVLQWDPLRSNLVR
jgi:Ser/Thr protein kinase RdoA (MazF antagonist)